MKPLFAWYSPTDDAAHGHLVYKVNDMLVRVTYVAERKNDDKYTAADKVYMGEVLELVSYPKDRCKINLGSMKVDFRDNSDNSIKQVSYAGEFTYNKQYNFGFACVPFENTLYIGHSWHRKNKLIEKIHTHIWTMENNKYKRAEKLIYELAKVEIYPKVLKEARNYFPNLNGVNVSE